ncbi:unnamed protein product [Periconia digitata]|uniref:Uncharacterized protein n=1 Tax=Periconia digitata TaxID=1303443 RepID=A0A9W4UC32_9PLEO|nr:unnamed protein product [Periconia digitata]
MPAISRGDQSLDFRGRLPLGVSKFYRNPRNASLSSPKPRLSLGSDTVGAWELSGTSVSSLTALTRDFA